MTQMITTASIAHFLRRPVGFENSGHRSSPPRRTYVRLTFVTLLLALRLVNSPATAQTIPPFSQDWLVMPITNEVRVTLSADRRDLSLDNGLIRRTWRLRPGAAGCWSYKNLVSSDEFIRAISPEAIVTIGGREYPVGGLQGAEEHGYIDPSWLETMQPATNGFVFTGYTVDEPQAPYPWKPRFGAPAVPWPPRGVRLSLHFESPATNPALCPEGLKISVNYELYAGAPIMAKWVTVSNAGPREVVIERMTPEQLAVPYSQASRLHAEADFMTFRMSPIRWELDPGFTTDTAPIFHEYFLGESVHYYPTEWLDNIWAVPSGQLHGRNEGGSRTLMSSRYPFGPDRHLGPEETFRTYRTFTLLNDTDDRNRQSLARRKLYRLL